MKKGKKEKTMSSNLCEEGQTSHEDDVRKLYLRQIAYADTFSSTSKFLEREGLYKRIAEFTNERDTIIDTVIDIGCGDCRLIRYVKDLNSNTTIIGVDINPSPLIIGNEVLGTFGHKVHIHNGINIAKHPDTGVLTLISDITTEDIPYKFEKGNVNLLQEDIRFGDVLRGRLEKDVGLADVIMYTMPGGFSPHIILEKGEKNYSATKAGIEMNWCVMSLGIELLKDSGRMIWALRAGSQNPETFKDVDLDDLNLSIFKPFYYINRLEIVNIDEQGQNLELAAYTISERAVYSTNDIRKMKHNFKMVVLLIEMIRKSEKR